MPTLNPFYPQRPWPFLSLVNHPSFIRMQSESVTPDPTGKRSNELFYGMATIAGMPAWQNGGTLADFMGAFGERAEPMLNELIRMNVFGMDTVGDIPTLVPCTQIAETVATSAVDRSKIASYYLPESIIAAIKSESHKRQLSASKFIAELFRTYCAEVGVA